ncbi:MAG: UDP-N-acetylmuramate dehydrogenase [Clostridia bacterium]|nr:UDP-N-acetylmuramate dehydrogenase [Clostridia bacterium]
MKKYLIPIYQNKQFCQLTTLGCGGTIKLVAYPTTVKQIVKAIKLLDKLKIKYVVLGKGSNVLASDEPYDGVVIVTSKLDTVKVRGNKVYAQAGVSTIRLGKILQQYGLVGGEFFACLPASVGGAVVCNAGCFGQDVQSVVTKVTVFYKGKVITIPSSKCGYGKRQSIFKNNGDYVVLSAEFKFAKGNKEDIANKIAQMQAIKAQNQPLNYRSAGCVFYHDKVAVSRLIDELGLKGYTVGGAKISSKHAGFVVNVDKATSKDIYLIILHAKNGLYSRYGVVANVEVCLINFTKDEENDLFAGSKK